MKKEYTNFEKAKIEADIIDKKIIDTLCAGKSFRVEAGAGSGKTYSLNKVIEWLQDNRWEEYKTNKQHAICITYTNAAVDVITSRLRKNSFIEPSTIHSFAWNSIQQYQSTLIKLVADNELLPADVNIEDVRNVKYTLGARYFEEGILYLFHNDVIKLFEGMLDNLKFQKIFSKLYPLILVDEYQDSFKTIIDKFIEYYISKDQGPQFGFFGDSWQTIYQSNNVCGLIEHNDIIEIPKTSNFRSGPRIVDFLNKIRPELPQISAIDEYLGEIIIIHNNDYKGVRCIESYFKDDLPVEVLEERVKSIETHLRNKVMSEEENLKILMITHKRLAAQQGYGRLLELLGDAFRNEEDKVLMFFMNIVEPIYNALDTNDMQLLFDTLGIRRYPITTKSQKQQWYDLYKRLLKVRNKNVASVLGAVILSNLIPVPPKVQEIYKQMQQNPESLYHDKIISEYANLSYNEILNGIEFLRPSALYSTDHGVKGEEYDNVIFVIGRGWNQYNFEKYMPMESSNIPKSNIKSYERNRNLFYVCCSRPKRRLVLFISTPLEKLFYDYLEGLAETSIFSYEEYLSRQGD